LSLPDRFVPLDSVRFGLVLLGFPPSLKFCSIVAATGVFLFGFLPLFGGRILRAAATKTYFYSHDAAGGFGFWYWDWVPE